MGQAAQQKIPMKYIFWNIRGILAPGRKKCIEGTIWPLEPSLIGFQETKQCEFSKNFLKNLMGNRNFAWNFLPYIGSAGGILVGVVCDVFEIISWAIGRFTLSVVVKDKSSDLIFIFTTIYGPSYEDDKNAFISKFYELCVGWSRPCIIGGYFNLVRGPEDKNNRNANYRWVDKFNVWVDMWSLSEIKLSGRMYTWANNQENLIMSRIDRIFCSTKYEASFPITGTRRCYTNSL